MNLFYHLVGVFLLTNLVTSEYNPLIDPYICGLPTCTGTGKFKYASDIQRNYKYSVEVRSLFNGTSKNESRLYVEGTATLAFLTPCDGLLTLADIKLSENIPRDGSESSEHANTQLFADMITEYSLRFSFKDGIISELCPREDEKEWVLNFKRGILSMLHNSMKRLDLDHSAEEVDVRGSCPTDYKVIGVKETSLLIEKNKDLDRCQGRSKLHSSIKSEPMRISRSNTNNILKSSSRCTLSIDHNVYNDIKCEETYLLQPFSNFEEGAVTIVSQQLTLLHEEAIPTTDDNEITKRTSLTFDHAIQTKPTHDDLYASENLIKQLCKQNQMPDRMDISDLFGKFIHNLRLLSYSALTALHGQAGAICPRGDKHLMDALPYIRTSGSLALMRDIIIQKLISTSTINEWIYSIGFIANPDKDTMEVAWNLLQEKTLSPNIALSIASLTHTYCSQHSDCRATSAVDSIVNYLENHFLQLYRSNKIDRNIHDQIMVTLKALSNTGVISEDFQQELFEVIENPNLDVGIRVAAVESFRRSSCEYTRSYFEQIFRNQDVDVEVRIASYLQIMRCPNYLLIRTIRHSLLKEEVNQVGSFVWTHLKNLLSTANPSKVEVQSLLSDKDLVKKFDSDLRKFSRNYEGSIYFNEYDVGGNYESNVIFSPSSYIPKSAMLNLTFDVFGEAVNILEVYGRMDGLEHYLESFFGPKGTSETLKENIMDKLRWPRSVKNNEIIKSQVEKLPNVMSNVHDEPKVALGFKIFGNDADYATFNGDSEIRAAVQTLDPLHHLKRILSGEEINYNKAAMFLDGKYVIPSGAGLPLSLTATGTASINIKLYGSLDAAGFSKDKELELDLTADIQPSVSVDLTGEMSVDAFYASTGIKLKTNMYTDSTVQGDVKVRGYRLASLKFSLPRKKNEIFVAKSEILVKQHDVEHPQTGNSSKRVSKSVCSWPIIDQTMGLKVCTEYSFINVTKMTNIPYFLAAGPANFRCHLQKSDPTATNYSFEYKLTQRRDLSIVSLTFDTPGSTVNRLLSANLTIDRQSQNLTLLLQSSAGTVLARGKYKNTPDEKFVQVALDINNRKHFDANVSLKRHHIRNGFSYRPNVYLGVNGERVFRISGNVDLMSKKGISQYSVDLKFETKRFNSRLYGYVSKSESSIEASLYNDYKFLHTKEQRVTMVFGAANRSHKNLVVFEGFSRLVSTAYPNMNFEGNATFQNIGGHTDLTIKLHQNPLSENHPEADFNTLKFELLLSSKVFTDNKRIFRAVTTLNRKSSNLDLKGEFIYETFRHNITTALLVKYGKNKEVSVTIFWSHPRTALEQIKTHVNVTIPSFTPMILKLEIVEKFKKDYMVDFSGTWFSGHSMSAFGFYQDKSTSLTSDHHVKLLLRSPNFRDINIDLQFHRDNDVLKLDLKGLHNNRDEYEFFFIHQTVSTEETRNQVHIKYINQLYRYVGSVYDGEYKKINADVHIDQLRDIVFSVYVYNKADNKSLGFDINWDANRDPDQKLMISANYEKYASFDYIANFIVSYPGRTIKGDYKFLLERRHLKTLASLSWDDGKTLAIDMDILYEYDRRLYLEIDTQLNTPFDNWRILKLDGSFEHVLNKYDLRGMMSWDKRQKITVDLFGDYTSKDSYFTCKYSCSIASSSDKLPNINTTINHMQNGTNFDTNLHLMYNPEFIIGAESQWKIDSNVEFTNLTGTLRYQTPFKGMKNAVLVGKIVTKQRNYIRGVAQLDMDHKKIDLDMEGYFKKITNCRLVINATTPDDKYQLRFIVSTEKRTFVAMVNYPTGIVGTEVILSMHSITNFDVKFHLATPVTFLQEVIIVAKLKPEEADFRLGWNSLLLGFVGVWHYANVTDFEYSYKIYTPIDDFEENGIVGKLILKEGLDFEVSVKLSNYKLGAKLLGQPKPKPLKELGIKLKNIYKTSELSQLGKEDTDDPFSWKGLIELDIIIYPTMKGELEIDQKGSSYILLSKLTMPNGVANILDEFEFIDILRMKNYLEITTPYPSFQTIESNFDLHIETGHLYVFGLNFDYQNRTELTQTGVSAKYIVERKGAEERIYNVTLKVNTPFKAFPKLNLFGAFETEENFYHTKLLFNTNRSDISVDATTEIENGLLELTSEFHVITPSVYIPVCQLKLTKLFSPANNNLEVDLQVPEKLQSGIHFKASWLIKSQSEFRSTIQLDTPFTGLENTTAGVDVYISDARSTVWTILQMSPLEVEVNADLENGILTVKSDLNFNGARYPVTVDCKILKPSQTRREFDGNLKFKDKLFIITGSADLIGNIPARVSTKFAPKDNSPPLMFEYQLSPTSLDRYKLVGSIQHSEKIARFHADLAAVNVYDWELVLKIVTWNNENFIVSSKSTSDEKSVTLNINAFTPIPKLENPKLGAKYINQGLQKDIYGFFDLSNTKGNASVSFIWIYLENMFMKAVGKYENVDYTSQSSVEAFYQNPQKTFYLIKAGGDIKIDRLWETGTNVTLILPPEKKMELEAHLKTPDENKETYSLFTNLGYKENMSNVDYLLKYRTSYTLRKHGIWGKISTEDKQNLSGNIEVEWNGKRFNNFANLKRSEKTLDLIYKLKSPKYIDRQLLVTEIKYKSLGDHHNLTCEAFYPEDRSVAYGTVDYKELANMNGTLNITIPHRSLKYTGVYFNTKTNAITYNRYIKVFWDGDNAVLDNTCDIKTGPTMLDHNMKGILIIEIPLKTRHIALVDYEYDKNDKISVGDATVGYNGIEVVRGKYNCLSESQTGLDKDTVHLEIINQMLPVGADYVYKHEYGTTKDRNSDPVTKDSKTLHLYHPKDRSKFSLNGELNIRTTWSGQEYIIIANHANRTIKFLTDYDVLDKEYKQHSRLELSPSHWIEYDLNLFNRTVDEIFDAQQAVINVIYPRRSFTAQGFYNISDSIVSTDVSLVWDKDNKTVQAGLDWRRASPKREQLLLQIKHPSFERDVSFHSEYGYNKSTIDGQLVVDYSLNPDQKLTLGGKVNDNSNWLTYNYTYNVWAEHNATNLNLDSRGDFYWNPSEFGTEHITNYKRSYLPLSTSETLARVNLDHNEIELKKDNMASGKSYFWGRYEGKYPVYIANMSAVYDMNDTQGEFYMNFDDKLVYSVINMTEDGSQSMHLYGIIPDARRAMCNIWRDYEEKRVSDVSYYLKLNHSRLIMSSLRWRPELISDVQNNIRETVMMFYTDMLEGINNTKQYMKAETMDAVNGIWLEARPLVQNFISDLRNLTVIEEDIEEFRVFLNRSYHANDFYIRDITSTLKTMFDESLKSHLQSLPKIVQEVWSVLGNSGEKIRKSVLWVIEKVKLYYKNTTDFIHGLINGDPIEHLSSGLDKLLEKYDKFIKDLHVTVIKYMENVWNQFSTLVVEHWHTGLASIEPTFLKFIHYLETIVWNTGKEFLDFLYQRKSEIIESPFFVQFTKFSHDVDTFYRDITGNNTIASIYKYSEIAWEFLTEKYLNVIPFGKELLDIATEIVTELKQIGDIPSVKYFVDRWKETCRNIRYYYEYFDMEGRIHGLIKLVYIKISEMSVTALENENRYRIPKTKFVFEPNDGIMLLEQKLPMSWHAFNETPKFKEIPEIKKVYDLLSYLEVAQISFWNLYRDYKLFTDPSEWMPPFKGYAMLAGSSYYVTFDKTYYDFRGTCTYLLATDFIDHNFTLLASHDVGNKSELILILNKQIVRINLFKNKVLIGDSATERLPAQIGATYLYRNAGIFMVESSLGFILECNMKFQICTFRISGWYFGRTAGLWGTFNNEPSDDFLTSKKLRASRSDLSVFGESWALEKSCKTEISKKEEPKTIPREVATLCEEFFTSKVSQLSTCFSRIPKDSFLSMCLNSTSEQEACMSAVSYINLCSYANTPLRIPDTCVKCNLLNGTEKQEGNITRLHGSDVPRSADIVFIVEAKDCNRNIRKTKNFDMFVELLEKELRDLNIKNNKYAVVVFGGDGVYEEPRSIIVDGNTFADSRSILSYFDNIPRGNGSSDIFNGIMFAYNLIFRPGVSRNFVLVPCSGCNKYNMVYDYSTIHQLLSESAISFHILMKDQFKLQKDRDTKVPFGIDRRFAYTKRDVRGLTGDQPLRKSIILPKSTLGLCLSLAVETNGTVFSGKLMGDKEKKNAKKVATVFAKTVARSAAPVQCVDCECTAGNTGVSYMECYLCTMPSSTRYSPEIYGMDEDDDLNTNFFDAFSF